ncbi:CPBP family intramembrane glutamic endopeptidase [Microbacterium testaceum]|uniref:CPBP family intramembrane glutamic endopeptidase n=1 Tax=Microbacterium testaceum TaxID=2033 RepID=UPI00342956C0
MSQPHRSNTVSAMPPAGRFFSAFAVIVTLAVCLATAPVFFGADSSYLSLLTPVLQWVPFLTVLALVAIHRAGQPRRTREAQPSTWSLAAAHVRGTGAAITRGSLLALGALIVACFAPILIAGSAGVIELRVADGAGLAVALTLPVAVLFMIPVAGEELAWRGYLTTLLSPRGFAATTVAIAALWAVWHLPLTVAYAVAGELAPRDVASKTIDLLLAAVLVSALRYLSSSVWPTVFAHALFTSLFQMAQYNFMAPLSELSNESYWGYMAVSWATWIVVDAIFVVSVFRRTRGRLSLAPARIDER